MFRVISPLTKSGGGRVVDADLIPLSCDLVYGDEWVHGPGNPDQRTFECLPFERAIATTFVRAGNDGAPPRAGQRIRNHSDLMGRFLRLAPRSCVSPGF